LRGLTSQRRPADQVIIGTREGDEETTAFLSAALPESSLPVEIAGVTAPGVIASMAAAARQASGDIVCLLDDDAEPEPDWLEKIEARFAAEADLGILGGRDLLQDNPEMRRREPMTEKVGIFQWFGRILGNHHRGSGPYRYVDIVKGCNAAIRGPLLRRIGFESRLRGKGAQVHWELALCLDAASEGYHIRYDPEIRVLHHVAPRHDNDLTHRGIFSPAGLADMVWNEHFIVVTRCGLARRSMHMAWSLLVGTKTAPGILQFLRLMREGDPHRRAKLATTYRAIWEGYTSSLARESKIPESLLE